MDQACECTDEWIKHAITQALALRETVRGQPYLRELVDVILFDLGVELARRQRPLGA